VAAASICFTSAFLPVQTSRKHARMIKTTMMVKEKQQTQIDEDAPAGIVGAEFFGGNKQKEEFYDETAEQKSVEMISREASTFIRFQDREAFTTDETAGLAASLQSQINRIVSTRHDDKPLNISGSDLADELVYSYTKGKLDWITPLQNQSPTPLEALNEALDFYKFVDLAVVSGQQLSETEFELQWELSVTWPTFWEPRVLILGSSTICVENMTIQKQYDKVVDNGGDLLGTLSKQILPRFWDLYHIGMTPSAELLPQVNRKEPGMLEGYQVYDIPSRWFVQPSRKETGTRQDRNAQTVPNHAFSCIIKTMGPTRQRYVPTSGIEVQVLNSEHGEKFLEWKIPISVEFQSRRDWAIPGEDEEASPQTEPNCCYKFEKRRKVATLSYGGDAQDEEISSVRKKLYEQVLKDGFKPKLDENGRPIFFFLSHTTKACYTNEGLGMCVYEWRPKWAKANEVGLELQVQESSMLSTIRS